MAAIDLFASIGRPVASRLKADDVRPQPPPAVWSGSPVLLFGDTEASELSVTWEGGAIGLPIPAGTPETGETVRLLQGSRLITDWESRYPSAEALAPLEKRKQSRVAGQLRRLSEDYGLASREMSLVAVMKRTGDRPGNCRRLVSPLSECRKTLISAATLAYPCHRPVLFSRRPRFRSLPVGDLIRASETS